MAQNRKSRRSRPARQPLIYGGSGRPVTMSPEQQFAALEADEKIQALRGALMNQLGNYANRVGELVAVLEGAVKTITDAAELGLVEVGDLEVDPSAPGDVLKQSLELLTDRADELKRVKALTMLELALVANELAAQLPEVPTLESIAEENGIELPSTEEAPPADAIVEGTGVILVP